MMAGQKECERGSQEEHMERKAQGKADPWGHSNTGVAGGHARETGWAEQSGTLEGRRGSLQS